MVLPNWFVHQSTRQSVNWRELLTIIAPYANVAFRVKLLGPGFW